MTRTAIYLFVFALIASAMVGVAGAAAPNPTYGTAVVDGSTGEWNLGSDFFANMYRAGNPAKPLESTAYLRYDCTSGTVYVLVLSEPNVPTLTWPDDAWVKINGGKSCRRHIRRRRYASRLLLGRPLPGRQELPGVRGLVPLAPAPTRSTSTCRSLTTMRSRPPGWRTS